MNEAHIHLTINHLPVIGLMIGAALLTLAVFAPRNDLTGSGLWTLLVAGILALPVYQSGEAAEDFFESNPRIEQKYLEDHEHAAETALIVSLLTAGCAALSLWTRRRGLAVSGVVIGLTLTLSWASVVVVSVAARSGALISHPELRYEKSDQQPPATD